MSERVNTIEKLLIDAFAPTEILIKDQSHLHAGHAGAKEGKGHFAVKIVSEEFAGQSQINRHRMVYAALGSFMQSDIHALQINAISPMDHDS
jgi:BolA protein